MLKMNWRPVCSQLLPGSHTGPGGRGRPHHHDVLPRVPVLRPAPFLQRGQRLRLRLSRAAHCPVGPGGDSEWQGGPAGMELVTRSLPHREAPRLCGAICPQRWPGRAPCRHRVWKPPCREGRPLGNTFLFIFRCQKYGNFHLKIIESRGTMHPFEGRFDYSRHFPQCFSALETSAFPDEGGQSHRQGGADVLFLAEKSE